ncbi:class I SAM-dependent methyltransferase [Aliifodinibius sp. S!AR15-10]|uniref:class I SAM-dependent methyltransferase n=1 Tax=Aliifodinibius sp. S!AR15-10 TaxID=2950437 RepID=UPI0028557647|nr:class I SAM-dependent methyltransferase [Aliifodinibius sp. S!AR15-10]MDR8393298.1 class I SAM-dependent methyltransferase [Aliifodinibius sp. S!AR15-10]
MENAKENQPEPEFMAQQLRKPSGEHAGDVGQKMNKVNGPLYDLTFDVMQPRDNEAILEVGFGTGKFFDNLFARAKRLNVSGIDYSEKMVEMARQDNQPSINSGKLDLKLGNSSELPYASESFDKVFCNMVIYFWDHPESHLKEIHRVLKPGGKFFTGMRTRESMLVFPFVEYGFNLYSISEWEEILTRHVFSVINTQTQLDPELEMGENKIQLKSCCIEVQKVG